MFTACKTCSNQNKHLCHFSSALGVEAFQQQALQHPSCALVSGNPGAFQTTEQVCSVQKGAEKRGLNNSYSKMLIQGNSNLWSPLRKPGVVLTEE